MEKIEEMKEFLKKHKPALSISRIPDKTKETFIKLAKEEYADDYGMTLKFLLDYYLHFSLIEQAIENHEIRILQLENPKTKQETKPIRMMSGKIIKKEKR